jgi:hypothetical protein
LRPNQEKVRSTTWLLVGQGRGYKLEKIDDLPPETIARAGEGDAAALKTYDERGCLGSGAARPISRRWVRTWRRAGAPRSNI